MSFLIGEEKLLDDGDSALPMSSTIHKKQEISALLASANGCELISTCCSMLKKELGICEERNELLEASVVNSEPPSACNNTGVLDLREPAHPVKHEVVDEGSFVQPCLLPHHSIPENLGWKDWRCPSLKRVSPVCDLPAATHLINHEVVDEGASVQPCLLPHNPILENLGWEEQECPSRERLSPVFDLPAGAHPLKCEVVDEETSVRPCLSPHNPFSENLGWEEQGCPSQERVFLVCNLPAGAHPIKRELVDEGTSVHSCLLPHNPISESFGWKEQGYPSRNRVSPDCDFPAAHPINDELVDEGTSVQPCLQPHNPNPENLGWKEQECPSQKRVSPVCEFSAGVHPIRREAVDEGTSVQPCLQPHKPIPENLGWKEQECPSRKRVSPGCDLPAFPAGVHPIKREVVDEGTSVQPCLKPHHTIPENLGPKERWCSSRKRISPVRDLPNCGRKVPRFCVTQDKHMGKCGRNFDIREAVVGEQLQQSVNIGKSGDILEESIRSHEGSFVRMMMQAPSLCKSSKIHGREENLEDSNDVRGKGLKRSKNKGKAPVKDINKKKKSIEFSDSNMKLEDSIAGVENQRGLHGCVGRNKCICSTNKSDVRRIVRDTLRLFHGVLRKLVQADETKTKGRVDSSIQLIAAANILKDHGKYINTKKIVGHVPGVEVGDLFNYRIELTIIGLHRQIQRGIDFIKRDGKLIAISVVDSGRYDNDMVNSNVLIYSGQGGNVAGGCKQLIDQKLEDGNLALKNSIDAKNLVRVIRGFKERKQYGGKRTTTATYTYDGLYTVERYWHDVGPHGKWIYKFELRRAPDQPELPRFPVKKVKKSKKSKTKEGICVNDIAKGKEKPPIYNTMDDEKPPPFTYITAVMYPDWCRPLPPKGCDCKDGCSDSKQCACARKNGGEIPYNYSGAIVEEKSIVYECGPSCKCPPTCHNRVSQHGIKFALEIFKTESMGWGVRSLCSITSGSFVCEYIGELLDDNEAEQRIDNDEYLFNIGKNYNDPTLREGLSALIPDMPPSCSDVVENVGFTLDAAKFGNVGRFINHSCSPNLFPQNVLYDHDDKRIPHIMFFAAQNIPPLQELTYHCNYTIDQVFDSKGNIRKKNCNFGSTNCAGRMY